MAVSAVDTDRDRQTKDMERDRDRHPTTSFTRGAKTAYRLLEPLGVIRPYSSYQKPPILSIPAAEPLRLAPLGTSP